MLLYKYRSLSNFKNFVDIIMNQRLYAAPYADLNDPMEGHYFYRAGHLAEEVVGKLKGEKSKLRICSLSRTPGHPLMWAHYADGHRGVVIGVEVNTKRYDVRPVRYDGPLSLYGSDPQWLVNAAAKGILSCKHAVWAYEEEERVFVEEKSRFVRVKVCEVILGSRMSVPDQSLVKKLVASSALPIQVSESPVDRTA